MTNNKSLIHRNMTFNDTFQSSLVQKNNEKFTMDKSLIKGIKQNDVSKIVDKNQLSSGTQNKQFYDQYKQVEGIVLETRKRYDNQKSKTLKCEQQIQKLKIQKQKLTEENNKLTQISENNKRKFEETNKKLQQITTLMQSTIYKKDIFTNIRQNIKHDLVVFRKRYLDKDIKLLRQNSKLKSVKSQHQNKVSLSKRCREMLGSVEKNLHENQLSRTSKIQSFCQVLDRRQTAQQNRQIRQRQIQEAMISAMTDKLSQEKQWIKMLNSNLFLKSVLKSKMERLMAKYNQIQLSFHKMKQATSLKNSNQFIEKFLSREETYGLLLEAISQKERELQELKQEHAQLQRINQKYQYQGEEMTDENKKKIIINPTLDKLEVKNPNTVLNQINQKLVQISTKRQLMYQWGVRFISAFKQHKNKNQVTKKFPKTKFKQLFLEVMSTINIFLKDLATQQNHEQKIKQAFMKNNPKQKFMTGQLLQKNRRVRTVSTLQHQGQGFDDKDMMYDDISQADYIQYNRRAVKKNDIQNRKFRIKTKPN